MSEDNILLGTALGIHDLLEAKQKPELLLLDDYRKEIVVNCRQTLNQLNSDEKPVYGVSTGFGHLENKWIPPEKQSQLQVNLIRSHAIGTGDPVPREITKLALILLANSLAKGHSGIRLKTLERILFYIKKEIIPISYTIGSLGASGDLAPLSHMALTLIGEGEVWYLDQRRSTSEVLDDLGLEPLDLEAKEGLALINGTHFITAYGLDILEKSRKTMKLSLIASGMTIEALRATDTPFRDDIARVRGHPGHINISKIMRKLLRGSHILESHKDPLVDHKTQDAYAIRCIPQVMGAIWDAFAYLERTLSIEINAVTDNPLIFPEYDDIVSGGNFHAEPLGFPLESVAMALVELANITEARIARLVSPFTPELPAFLAKSPGLESGYMIAHYTAAALVNKLRGMSHPNVTDNIPVSGNQEDHVSMVMNTAVRCSAILDLVEEVVTFELMMALRGLNLVERPNSSRVLESIISSLNQEIPFQLNDHVIHTTLSKFKETIKNNVPVKIFDDYIGFPDTYL